MSVRGEVQLRICGEALSIAPTYSALEAIEMRLGVGVPTLLARVLGGDARLRDMAVIVYEGLRGAGHSGQNGRGDRFTLDAVGEDVCVNFSDYAPKVGEFLGNALGGKPDPTAKKG